MQFSKHSRAVVCAASLFTLQAAQAADLQVTVKNVKNSTGSVRVGLFAAGADFPGAPSQGKAFDLAAKGEAASEVKLVFQNVAAGRYAASAIHDEDGNGKLTRNVMGIPSEPYGFSGVGAGLFGPPPFADASFEVGAEDVAVEIILK